jgi:hypothetical protein
MDIGPLFCAGAVPRHSSGPENGPEPSFPHSSKVYQPHLIPTNVGLLFVDVIRNRLLGQLSNVLGVARHHGAPLRHSIRSVHTNRF